MEILEILQKAVSLDAADVFLIAGLPVTFKCGGRQQRMENGKLTPEEIGALAEEIYALSKRSRANYERGADDDFSFAVSKLGRFRVNIFRQRGSPAAVIRVIRFGLPDPAGLGIPESVLSLAENKKGLVLITGSAGTGKSTTLACMIDRINRTRDCHIITMEDPIEYIHRHEKAIVTQREISIDTPGYLESLRSALRESPDVILLGEMRDYDTISAAITAAETGVLLLSTLHTSSAANTISRILDVFPAAQQKQALHIGVSLAGFQLRYEALVGVVFGPRCKDGLGRGEEPDLLRVVVQAIVLGQEHQELCGILVGAFCRNGEV